MVRAIQARNAEKKGEPITPPHIGGIKTPSKKKTTVSKTKSKVSLTKEKKPKSSPSSKKKKEIERVEPEIEKPIKKRRNRSRMLSSTYKRKLSSIMNKRPLNNLMKMNIIRVARSQGSNPKTLNVEKSAHKLLYGFVTQKLNEILTNVRKTSRKTKGVKVSDVLFCCESSGGGLFPWLLGPNFESNKHIDVLTHLNTKPKKRPSHVEKKTNSHNNDTEIGETVNETIEDVSGEEDNNDSMDGIETTTTGQQDITDGMM